VRLSSLEDRFFISDLGASHHRLPLPSAAREKGVATEYILMSKWRYFTFNDKVVFKGIHLFFSY